MASPSTSFVQIIKDRRILITPNNCDYVKYIGNGSFGAVECVQHKESKIKMALKKIDLNKYSSNDSKNKYLRSEGEFLARLSGQCRGVVQYYGSLEQDGHLWIYMELMDLSLEHINNKINERIPESILGRIAFEMLRALNDMLTKCRVMHRDIKPSNVLLDRHGHVKLCDFGLSRLVEFTPSQMSSFPGCSYYQAPERFDPSTSHSYDHKSDIWSVGLTIYQLAIGKYPFEGNIIQVIQSITSDTPNRFRLPSGHSEWFQQFIDKCLAHSPERADYFELLEETQFIKENMTYEISSFVQSILNRYFEPSTSDKDYCFTTLIGNRLIKVFPVKCERVRTLGLGSFGVVEYFRHRETGFEMAVKKINLKKYKEDDDRNKYFRTEVEIMERLSGQCRGVVQYYGSLETDGHLWICMELMDLSLLELDRLVRTHCGLGVPESILGRIAFEMLSALDDMLTKCRVMHRDIKPDNVLLDRHGHVKLCDFGLSRLVEGTDQYMSDYPGTYQYQAPERLDPSTSNSYDHKSDIWSVGLTIYQLAIGKYPFEGNILEVIRSITSNTPNRFPLPPCHSEWVQQFIDKCLTHSSSERADYPELLQMIESASYHIRDISHFIELVLQLKSSPLPETINEIMTTFYNQS